MGNLIIEAGAPGRAARQAKAPAGNNGADNFSTEMADAMKDARAGREETARAEGESVREKAVPAKGVEEDKGMVEPSDRKGEGALSGLFAVPVDTAPPIDAGKSLAQGTAAGYAGLEAAGGVKAKAEHHGEAAESVEAVPGEDGAGNALEAFSENKAAGQKHIDPDTLPEAEAAPDDAGDVEGEATAQSNIKADGKEGMGSKGANAKAGEQGAAVSEAQSTVEADGAKTGDASTAEAEQAGDTSHGGLGFTGKDTGGRDNRPGNTGAEAGGVSQMNRQVETYEAAAEGAELSGAEKAEVYDKLSAGVRMSVARDGGTVSLSLRPDHLGNLNIKLNIEDGLVKARIVVESAAVKEALDADSGALKEVFLKNNLVLDKYSVEIAGQGFSFEDNLSGFSQFTGFDADSREGFSGALACGPGGAEETENTEAAAAGFNAGRRGSGIDLFA